MALFQKTVIKKHLLDANSTEVDAAYQRFSAYFHDSVRQQNIRNSKEEQFQEGFLRELFGHIFGYTLNPEPNFNLKTELKNTSNSKKVDGAIVFDGKAIAVIELKGTNTTDLNSIETQAFGYKNNQAECNYVITSNFEKLRFYIDNTIDYEEFNLFNLTRNQFSLLYLCLSYENIKNNVPKRLKAESVSQEDAITKKLYKDYSEFKRALYSNLVELNLQFDKLLLYKKTQKLLDRFLFIFFAEDRLLLPTNLIFRINQEWKNLMKMRMTVSLYERYKVYFNDLNVGAKVTLPAFGKKTGDAIEAEFEIFAYNGGLFVPDEVLDNVKIDDEVLHVFTEKMSHYDFDSDVDVNILGHIFENSLNEIDEIKSEIEGETVDKTKTRRKKDGVFYTPKYITKYIVDNTVGKLCAEKKAELKLADEDYINDKKIQTKTKKAHLDKLTDYRAWLLQLTICDPACGSGAFLNQALEFLIAEHRYVDELQAKLMGDSMILSDVETSILENNIYGVDLNDESVEIAKLSLWLRTAQKGRKLNSLNNNIKCGNSLIDDPEVARDKAFSWEKEFPEVFKEKNKFAFHITTCVHDSRTSERMIKYKARERRFDGTKPDPEVFPMTKEEEDLIASTIADIVREDKLNIAAFNLCWDHMHILLVCEEEEVPRIMQKIKAKTGRAVNIFRGKTKVADNCNKGACSLDDLVVSSIDGHKSPRGEKQNSFWTQKYNCKHITSDDYFWNTYNYIEKNKVKHNLPKNPKLEKIILGFVKTYEDCFKTEYKGGFDVVIGNPPYIKLETIRETSLALENMNYQTFDKRGDLYVLFVEKGFNIAKSKGYVSYIMPNKWLQAGYGEKLRNYFLTKELTQLIDFGDIQIFEGATTYPVIINARNNKPNTTFEAALLKKDKMHDFDFNVKANTHIFETEKFDGNTWIISSSENNNLLERLSKQFKTLKDFVNGEANYGIKPGLTEAFIVDKEKINDKIKNDINSTQFIKKFVQGRNIQRYGNCSSNNGLIIIEKGFTHQNIGVFDEEITFVEMEKRYPGLMSWLEPFKDNARKRTDKGDYWWELRACDYYADFLKPKIMFQVFQVSPCFIYDETGLYCNNSMWILPTDNKALLGVLNSKMGWWLTTKYCTQIQNGCQLIWKQFGQIPIPPTTIELTILVERMLNSQKDFQTLTQKLSSYICSQYQLEKLSGKLSSLYDLDFSDFIKELNKAIKAVKGAPLSKKDEFEWMELFEENKQKALALKAEIDRRDKEIDQMVYELYGLTEEEIKIVEGN